jgi:hypothetical protein
MFGEPGREVRLRDKHRRLSVLEHEPQTLRGILGIERQTGAAGLHGCQHGHHQIRRAFQAEANQRVRLHAQAAKVTRQFTGTYVQLLVAELHLAVADGHGGWGASCLRLEPLVNAAGQGKLHLGLIELLNHLLPLLRREPVEVLNCRVRGRS